MIGFTGLGLLVVLPAAIMLVRGLAGIAYHGGKR